MKTPAEVFELYLDNVLNYVNDLYAESDERLMRTIEEKLDVPEVGADDFRRKLICWYAGFRRAHHSSPRYVDFPEVSFHTAIQDYSDGTKKKAASH